MAYHWMLMGLCKHPSLIRAILIFIVMAYTSRIDAKVTRQVSFDITSEKEFEEEVLHAENPVIVDFYAIWCQPCKVLGPRLEAAIKTVDGVDLAKVNIDKMQELAIQYGVAAVPTVLAFKQGELIDQFLGLIDQEKIEEFVNKIAQKD